mmetsp:Transcript_8680/g.39181  ORF Transcript_8680/g.39181 Transcript_8680/m.39181 type:complete len:262 (-) Transcript_8680:566-1351(-)
MIIRIRIEQIYYIVTPAFFAARLLNTLSFSRSLSTSPMCPRLVQSSTSVGSGVSCGADHLARSGLRGLSSLATSASSASRVTARLLCFSISYTFSPNWSITCTWGRLRDARLAFECVAGTLRPVRVHFLFPGSAPCSAVGGISAHRTLCARPPAARDCAPSRLSSALSNHWVLGSIPAWSESTTTIRPSAAFAESATCKPSRRTRLCSLVFQLRMPLGPCATPPPRICGALSVPTRARPPPFCGLAFLVVPLTSERVSVLA